MQLSVGIPPGPRTLEYAQLAQELGYDRVWLYDSAALYEDIWIWMARLAEHTDLDLGTAVLVPNLRHVMTTASAIATVERMAPGRLACGFGTGATARWVLNKPALSWATTQRYLEQLRGLLRGEVVEVDGERCQMIHHPDLAIGTPDRHAPARVRPRPEGQGHRRGDVRRRHHRRLHRHGRRRRRRARAACSMAAGTVLDDGEDMTSERVAGALGPWYVVRYHGVWQAFPEALAGMPGGEDWLAGIERRTPRGRASPRGARGSHHQRDAARRRRARARRRRARDHRLGRHRRRDPPARRRPRSRGRRPT